MRLVGLDLDFFNHSTARWNEWSRSVWELQKERLKSGGQGLDWRFVSYVAKGEDETVSAIDSSISYISGHAFSET